MALERYLVDLRNVPSSVAKEELLRIDQLLDKYAFISSLVDVGVYNVYWDESDPAIEKLIDLPLGTIVTKQ